MKKFLEIFLAPAVIILANVVLVWPFFLGGYTQQIGSIESVFIADARFVFDNFPNLAWNPYWYTGFPFHLFYTPLLPFLMALGHFLYAAISIASWYRILIGVFYVLTPASFYFLARYLTGKGAVGFLAALIFSFSPSIGYLMPQVGDLAGSYGLAPWRFLTLVLFGEGGHIVGLFFLPLALLFIIKSVREGSRTDILFAVISTGLLALANIIALIGFAAMLAIVLMVELVDGSWLKKIGRALIITFLSFGLVAFWYNLSFINASLSIGTGGVGGGVGTAYLRFLPLIFLLAPILFVFISPGKKQAFKPVLMALAWIIIFFAASYFWFNGQTMLLPQPNRYLPEMDMGVALLVSWVFFLMLGRIIPQSLEAVKVGFYLVLGLLVIYFPAKYIDQVRELIMPHSDITQTSEYRIASWLKDNTSGERVYASGTSAFWLNTFADIPQVRGGNDGVVRTPWILHGVYQINTGENAPRGREGEVAADWLRAFNVSYLVLNLPTSAEIFHDFRYPERFGPASGFASVTDLGGDAIYKVPIKKPSLAQGVERVAFENLEVLKDAADAKKLQKYVDYIDGDGNTEAVFSWQGIGKAQIKTNLKEGEGVGVQIAYDSGWKASANGQQLPIKKDVVGFMFLDSGQAGDFTIDLEYGRTWDIWLGYLVTILSIGGLIAYTKLTTKTPQDAVKLEENSVEDEE